jgi:hypothetical protein
MVRRPVVRIAASSRISQRWKVGWVNAHANGWSNGLAAEGMGTMWASLCRWQGMLLVHPYHRRGGPRFSSQIVHSVLTKGQKSSLDNCYTIVFKGKECRYYDDYANSTWKYYVEELPCAQDLSNWVLELPDCVKAITATPEPWERVHPDPNAHLDGIKWQTGGGFEAGIFTVKLRGCPPVKGTQVAAKGPDVDWGFIKGPGCSYK